jgi:glycosyltransferase involved in cell wall biosynthesis
MAKRFIANGHEVTFVTSSAYLSSNYSLKKGWNYLEIEEIKLHILHLPYSNNDSFIKRIWKFLQFSIKSSTKILQLQADVLFATSTPLTIAIPGLIYSKIKKVPMVFEVRDLWPELPIAIGAIKNPVIINLAKWLEKYTYKNSKRLVGLSPGMCDGIIKQGISSNLVTLATNSCDTDLFDVSSDVGVAYKNDKLPFLKNRKLIVYTGTFGAINKVGYIVDLAAEMKKIDETICFVAIGAGMEKNDIVEKAKSLNVFNENLYFLDPVAKTDIVKLLSAADLSISLFGSVTQMWHNSANKLFDALASSTPIAINYGGWQKDIIEKYQCGLVLSPLDHIASAKKVSSFLKDDLLYSKAKESCKYLAFNEYSRDIMAERIEKTLLEAVND